VFSLLSGGFAVEWTHDDPFLTSKSAATARHQCRRRHQHRTFVAGLIDRQRTIGAVCLSGGNENYREISLRHKRDWGKRRLSGSGLFLWMGHLLAVLFVCRGGIYSKKNTRFNLLSFSFFFAVCLRCGWLHTHTRHNCLTQTRSLALSCTLRCRFPVAACIQLLH